MTEADVEPIIQRAGEKFPGVTPRILSDNGPQLIARDFKEFIGMCGNTLDVGRRSTNRGPVCRTLQEGAFALGHRLGDGPGQTARGDKDMWAARDRKREAARERRKAQRHAAGQAAVEGQLAVCVT